jgi:signal transduction histidine kinase
MIDQVLTVIFITEDLLSSKTENQLTRTISKLNNCIEAQETAIQLIMHDLRGPLANIELVGNLLGEDELQEEDLKTYLKILQQSSRKASRLIDSYHCFYRVENGSYQIVQNKFRLMETIDDIFYDYEKAIQEKNLHYRLNWVEQPEPNGLDLTIDTDFLCFSIIINNLVKNAIEAAPVGSQITVTISCREKLLVTIHNLGAIPTCIRHQFFEKYITSEKVKGSGMGTYIVKKMMDILQGQITFHSSEEDGTFIQLSFPVMVVV